MRPPGTDEKRTSSVDATMTLLEGDVQHAQSHKRSDAARCIACGAHSHADLEEQERNVVSFHGSNPNCVSTALACCCDRCKHAEAFAQKLCTFVRKNVGDFKLRSAPCVEIAAETWASTSTCAPRLLATKQVVRACHGHTMPCHATKSELLSARVVVR